MENLKVEIKNKTAIVTLDRAKSLNALSTAFISEIIESLSLLEKNKEVRVCLITSSNEKCFCVGADLKERLGLDTEKLKENHKFIESLRDRMLTFSKPLIAVVNGYALGGGFELAMLCDFIVSGHNAIFALPEVKRGLIPGMGGTQNLSRLIGQAKAKELIFSGRFVEANEANEIGISNYLEEDPLKKAIEIANEISKNAPISIIKAKEAITKGLNLEINAALRVEVESYNKVLGTKDREEGIKAFNEKREPNFIGE